MNNSSKEEKKLKKINQRIQQAEIQLENLKLRNEIEKLKTQLSQKPTKPNAGTAQDKYIPPVKEVSAKQALLLTTDPSKTLFLNQRVNKVKEIGGTIAMVKEIWNIVEEYKRLVDHHIVAEIMTSPCKKGKFSYFFETRALLIIWEAMMRAKYCAEACGLVLLACRGVGPINDLIDLSEKTVNRLRSFSGSPTNRLVIQNAMTEGLNAYRIWADDVKRLKSKNDQSFNSATVNIIATGAKVSLLDPISDVVQLLMTIIYKKLIFKLKKQIMHNV